MERQPISVGEAINFGFGFGIGVTLWSFIVGIVLGLVYLLVGA